MVKTNATTFLEREDDCMKIIVAGCGKIGSTILARLVAEGHDVVVLDSDPDVISQITNIYDVMGVCGNCANVSTLSEAGADSARLFIATTASDELNMLACYLARKMGAHHAIARIRNPEYNGKELRFMREQLSLSMSINPEMLAARELFNILKLPSAAKIETFCGRNFEMIELVLKQDSPLDGLSLIKLREKFKGNYLVCIVQRGEEVYIPDGNFVLCAGDRIGLTASPTEIHKLLKAIGGLQKQAKTVMLLGGSRIAVFLARMLESVGGSVKVIDRDAKVCEDICEILSKASVVHGDGAQQELLLEEGIADTDAFIALTGMDEQNILMSIFAAAQKVPKVITKVNRDELISLAGKLGLDCVISPKRIVADVVVRYARALDNSFGSSVETLYNLMDEKAQAIEFNVKSDLPLLDIPLKDLQLKPNLLIAGIIRGREIIIPAGNDVIMRGDRVVVVSTNRLLQDLSDIMK